MGKFLTPIESFDYRPYVVEGEMRRDRVVLENNVVWLCDDGDTYVVPAGYVFNLASLPWWIGWALTKLGKHQRAACLHDWFYDNRTNSKTWADLQFRQAMDMDSVKGWRKWMAWSGVAVGGWFAWRSSGGPKVVKVPAE